MTNLITILGCISILWKKEWTIISNFTYDFKFNIWCTLFISGLEFFYLGLISLKLKIKKEMKRLVWSPYKIIPVLVQVLYFKETHSHSICLIGQCGNLKHDWIHLFSRNWRPLKCRALNESNDVEIALLCQYGSILQTQPDTYLNCIHWKTIEGWWYTFTRSFFILFP